MNSFFNQRAPNSSVPFWFNYFDRADSMQFAIEATNQWLVLNFLQKVLAQETLNWGSILYWPKIVDLFKLVPGNVSSGKIENQ